jgi:hypothetical protein
VNSTPFSEYNYRLFGSGASVTLMDTVIKTTLVANCANKDDQQQKELWIDQNSTALMVNQVTGSLVQRQ